jgi:hypothetical protein
MHIIMDDNCLQKFIAFGLVEEFINSDVGSNVDGINNIFNACHASNTPTCDSLTFKDSDASNYNLLSEKDKLESKMLRFNNLNIYVCNIEKEKHSIKLIIERLNETHHKLVLVNSGMGLENGGDKIFFASLIENTRVDEVKLSMHRAKNISQLYDTIKESNDIKSYEEHKMSEPKKLEDLEIQCSQQISGSCAYFSTLYVFYYMVYYGYQDKLNLDTYKKKYMHTHYNA